MERANLVVKHETSEAGIICFDSRIRQFVISRTKKKSHPLLRETNSPDVSEKQ